MKVTWDMTTGKVRVRDIKVDHTYQRSLDENRVKQIADNLDLSRIGTIELARRRDGSLWVVDGQHRLMALILAGKKDMVLSCKIHIGVTIEQEAMLFVGLNRGRRGPPAYNLYKAELCGKQEEVLEIENIVNKLSLKIGTAKARYHVCAISAVRAAHKNNNLSETLRVLKTWAGGDGAAFDGILITAVSNFLAAQESTSPDQLIEKLRSYEPDPVVVRNRITIRSRLIHSTRRGELEVLLEIYNKKRGRRARGSS